MDRHVDEVRGPHSVVADSVRLIVLLRSAATILPVPYMYELHVHVAQPARSYLSIHVFLFMHMYHVDCSS
jgi:hypothetical protein